MKNTNVAGIRKVMSKAIASVKHWDRLTLKAHGCSTILSFLPSCATTNTSTHQHINTLSNMADSVVDFDDDKDLAFDGMDEEERPSVASSSSAAKRVKGRGTQPSASANDSSSSGAQFEQLASDDSAGPCRCMF
jgi:hypothetical protein